MSGCNGVRCPECERTLVLLCVLLYFRYRFGVCLCIVILCSTVNLFMRVRTLQSLNDAKKSVLVHECSCRLSVTIRSRINTI